MNKLVILCIGGVAVLKMIIREGWIEKDIVEQISGRIEKGGHVVTGGQAF